MTSAQVCLCILLHPVLFSSSHSVHNIFQQKLTVYHIKETLELSTHLPINKSGICSIRVHRTLGFTSHLSYRSVSTSDTAIFSSTSIVLHSPFCMKTLTKSCNTPFMLYYPVYPIVHGQLVSLVPVDTMMAQHLLLLSTANGYYSEMIIL